LWVLLARVQHVLQLLVDLVCSQHSTSRTRPCALGPAKVHHAPHCRHADCRARVAHRCHYPLDNQPVLDNRVLVLNRTRFREV
jgi:hypothetical protein